jgi:sulfate adenylyltransferase
VEELQRAVRTERSRGAVVFFTGYSGSGKSTIAHVLYHKLLESVERSVSLLDGDVVRAHLSKGLGFSREDRDANIERIGFVASEIAKAGGIALCAAIAPYAAARERARRMVEKNGVFIEVFVDTPLAECEARDPKGLYRRAREGELPHFTGVDDPYEIPRRPELRIDTLLCTPEAAADTVYARLALAVPNLMRR